MKQQDNGNPVLISLSLFVSDCTLDFAIKISVKQSETACFSNHS